RAQGKVPSGAPVASAPVSQPEGSSTSQARARTAAGAWSRSGSPRRTPTASSASSSSPRCGRRASDGFRGASSGPSTPQCAERTTTPEVFDMSRNHMETVIIGGGQAGLSAGYHLAKRGLPFLILAANGRIGGAWRNRWDSLRLFTPAHFSRLPGKRLDMPNWSFPTKDELADYLESYARQFDLPVKTGLHVDRLEKTDGRFVITAGA